MPLPLILDHNPAMSDLDPKGAGGEANAGTVFLVDDDASVRRAMTRVLRAAGLAVSSFPSAAALMGAALPDQRSPDLRPDLARIKPRSYGPGSAGLVVLRPTQNWKMTTKEVEAGTDVIKEFAIPRLVNLNLDPREEHALSYQYQHFWVRFALGKVMTD